MIKICDKGIVKPLSIIYKNCTDTGIFPDLWKKSNIVPVHKNHTYVKKVGHTSEFPFGIYWWTLKNLKNQIFEKTKKKLLEIIIILQTCTKNHNHIRYSSRDMEWDNFFVILGHFLPFTFSLTIQKTNILKKWKKHLDMSSLQTCATKTTIKWYMLTQTWSVTDIIFCHFGFFLTTDPKNQNFEKM